MGAKRSAIVIRSDTDKKSAQYLRIGYDIEVTILILNGQRIGDGVATLENVPIHRVEGEYVFPGRFGEHKTIPNN